MQNFRHLRVWQKAHLLALSTYRITSAFPRQEQFGLTSQMRRSATSIAANIAEGCGRGSDADFARFLRFAIGSASELEYHFLLASDLKLLSNDEHRGISNSLIEVKRMLTGLVRELKADG